MLIRDRVKGWVDEHDKALPTLMLEMALVHTRILHRYSEDERTIDVYIIEYCNSYERLIRDCARSPEMLRGLNLNELCNASRKAAKCYGLVSDMPQVRPGLERRVKMEDWLAMQKNLVLVMDVIANASAGWTSPTVVPDFQTTTWDSLRGQAQVV